MDLTADASRITGRVFNIQRFSSFDGPGVRTVVFLKGCPLRCLWCHNPEGLRPEPEILYAQDRCILCGACAAVCPRGLHTFSDTHHFVREGCDACGKCADACVTGALQTAGADRSVGQVMEEVLRDRRYYGDAGTDNAGGITVSGGEPLLQWEFTRALLVSAHENGIGTCIETSGFASAAVFAQVAAHTDTLLFDYKASGDAMHRRLTGVPQTPILENLRTADRMGKKIILRCPVVPGANDTEEHWDALAALAAALPAVREIQLEPYHRIGLDKSVQMGTEDPTAFGIPEKERMTALVEYIGTQSGKPTRIS